MRKFAPLAAALAMQVLIVACAESDRLVDSETPTPSLNAEATASEAVPTVAPATTSVVPGPLETPDRSVSPRPTTTAPAPLTTTRQDPFLTIVDPYPNDGAVRIPTETSIQFVLYRDLPIVRLSLSPEAHFERVELGRFELRNPSSSAGVSYIYRPQDPLEPNTTYLINVEIGRVDEPGGRDTVIRSWKFTTSDGSDEDFAKEVKLPIFPSLGDGGNGALTGGTLLIEGPCLYLDQPDVERVDGERVFPLFEEGTVWWEGDLFFHRGNRYHVGDIVQMGGGTSELKRHNFAHEPDESCDFRRVWNNSQ